MNAVILAGGFGSRLKPLTDRCPKPMLEVAGVPLLDYTVSQLKFYGIEDSVLTLKYMPAAVTDFCDGYRGIKMKYSYEDVPLGTLGGVKAAEKKLDDVFFVMSGDGLSNIDLDAMLECHKKHSADITVAVVKADNPSLYGVVEEKGGLVAGFTEKPPRGEEKSDLISCGVYIVNKYVLDEVPGGVFFDFAKDLFPALLKKGRIAVYRHDGYWSDIGDKRSYYLSNFYMAEGGFYPSAVNVFRRPGRFLKTGNTFVSFGSSVAGRAEDSVLSRGARVASGGYIKRCLVTENAVVNGTYFDCIVGPDYAFYMGEGAAPADVEAAYVYS